MYSCSISNDVSALDPNPVWPINSSTIKPVSPRCSTPYALSRITLVSALPMRPFLAPIPFVNLLFHLFCYSLVCSWDRPMYLTYCTAVTPFAFCVCMPILCIYPYKHHKAAQGSPSFLSILNRYDAILLTRYLKTIPTRQ